jgi:hypothetical protein
MIGYVVDYAASGKHKPRLEFSHANQMKVLALNV